MNTKKAPRKMKADPAPSPEVLKSVGSSIPVYTKEPVDGAGLLVYADFPLGGSGFLGRIAPVAVDTDSGESSLWEFRVNPAYATPLEYEGYDCTRHVSSRAAFEHVVDRVIGMSVEQIFENPPTPVVTNESYRWQKENDYNPKPGPLWDHIQALALDKDPDKSGIPEALELCFYILKARAKDYDSVMVEDYMPFRMTSYVNMIYLKVMRAVSLVIKKDGGKALEDTLIDLINYGLFALCYLRRNPGGVYHNGGSGGSEGKS